MDPAHYGFLLVETVCRRRAELLNKQNAQMVYDPEKSGSLLVFYPDLTLFDGAAQLSSDGYFNSNNDPPWEMWMTAECLELLGLHPVTAIFC